VWRRARFSPGSWRPPPRPSASGMRASRSTRAYGRPLAARCHRAVHGRPSPSATAVGLSFPAAQPLLQDVPVGGIVIDHQYRQGYGATPATERGTRLGGWGCCPKRAMKAKVLPRPGTLSTVIVPPIRASQLGSDGQPRPVPPYLRRGSRYLLARRPGRCAPAGRAEMPMPVSSTVKRRLTS